MTKVIIDSFIDLCAGLGAFPLAMERVGITIKNHYFSEIDKYAIQNYRYNFPNAIYIGPIGHISESWPDSADFITFGWPCQGNSINGGRSGLAGSTGSQLIVNIAEILNHYKPRHFFAENVPGLYSVNKGIDIIKVFGLLSDLDTDSMQYDVELQFLNTRKFGIPQNRERLYFIGHRLTTGGSGQKVFPLENSDCGFIEGSTETAVIINTFTAGGHSGGHSGGHHSGITLLRWQNKKQGIVEDNISPTIRHSSAGTDIRKMPGLVVNDNGNLPQIPEPKVKQKRYSKGNAQAQRVYDLNGIAPIQGALGGGQGADRGLFEFPNKTIRRFTPIEVARLFGLPDEWTKYGINDKGEKVEISDSQQYKLLGNSITAEPLTTIFRKLAKSEI